MRSAVLHKRTESSDKTSTIAHVSPRIPTRLLYVCAGLSYDCTRTVLRCENNRDLATIRHDSFEHAQNIRGPSRSTTITHDSSRFFKIHYDAVTYVSTIRHDSPRMYNSWRIVAAFVTVWARLKFSPSFSLCKHQTFVDYVLFKQNRCLLPLYLVTIVK